MATYAVDTPAESLSTGALLVLAVAALDFGLEQSVVLPALPALAEHYQASLVSVTWLATGFLLAAVVAVPLGGRLGDLYGKRRLLLVMLGAFALGSLLCALTSSIEVAIAGRIIQGLGFGISPLVLGLVRDTVDPPRVPRAIGALIGAGSAGAALGFLLSGILVDQFSAAAIFWFLGALAAALMVAVFALVPESPVRARVPVDFAGAVLLAGGLVALLLAISKGNDWDWTSARIIGLFAASAALIAGFVGVERRVREPLVDLRLIATRPFLNANVCAFAVGFLFLVVVFVPQLAATPEATGYGLGLTATEIGLVLVPTGIASLVGGFVGGRVVDLVGSRLLVAIGSAVGVVAYLWLSLAHGSVAEVSAGSALVGLAWGLILTGIFAVVVRAPSTDKTGVAVGVNLVVRNTAVSLGLQIGVAILTAVSLVGRFPSESGYTRVFLLGALGGACALVASRFLPGRRAAAA
jgi:MFS family permease